MGYCRIEGADCLERLLGFSGERESADCAVLLISLGWGWMGGRLRSGRALALWASLEVEMGMAFGRAWCLSGGYA